MTRVLVLALCCAAVWAAHTGEPFRLTYFDGVKGRAEKVRLLFVAANKTDALVYNRITSTQWGVLKDKTPYGQLPILRHGKVRLAQSVAILTYCALELKLAPPLYDNEANAVALEVTLAAEDLKAKFNAAKAARDTAGFAETWRAYAAHWNKRVASNKDGPEYFVGKTLTFADVAVYDILQQSDTELLGYRDVAAQLADTPLLQAVYARVAGVVEPRKDEL